MDDVTRPPFTWSYSRLTAFETCPHRHYEKDVLKRWPEEESPQLKWGNDVHAALAEALRSGSTLDEQYQVYQHWVDKIRRTPGKLLVEEDCRWGITRAYRPTAWMAKDVWLRAVADAIKVDDDVAMAVDFKAGKSSNVDVVQNQLVSLIILIYFPKVQVVRSDFIWLNENDKTTQTIYRTEAPDYWAEIMPRVKKFEQAYLDMDFPPTPNRFCKRWCPVKSCEHWGK